jgi:hypothetical protein
MKDDDNKVESKLRAWAKLMVVVDPSKTEEEYLYAFINTARGRSRANHLNDLHKKDDQPMLYRLHIRLTWQCKGRL